MFSIFKSKSRTASADALALCLIPLAEIADKYEVNQLTGMAQRVGCCGPSSMDPANMILVWDRIGRPLLTGADCLKARHALEGTRPFKDEPISSSQEGC